MPTTSSHCSTIAYTKTGSGPAILFIQGVGAIGHAWRPQIEALAKDHTVLAFDNRGIGDSPLGSVPLSIEAMAADALAVADAAGASTFDVVGHSMGGVIAQHVALSATSRVRSLSLLCTFARGAQGARLSWDLLVAGLRSRIGPRSARRRAFVELVMPRDYLVHVDRDTLEATLADLFGRDMADQPPIVLAQLKAMSRYAHSASSHRWQPFPRSSSAPPTIASPCLPSGVNSPRPFLARDTSRFRTPATLRRSSAPARSTHYCCST
jgi:aminoacrylate hydrolase